MKRRRQSPSPAGPRRLRVQQDEATGDSAPHKGPRYSRLTMPHERDERPHEPGAPNVVTTRAADDVAEGRRDTDLYSQAGADFDRKARRS